MTFEEQIINVKVRIDTTPRVYIEWENTEDYRDRTDSFERKMIGNIVYYENTNNRDRLYCAGDSLFNMLEKLYQNNK